MAEKAKVTEMVLTVVNLQCRKCYKKVKKLLCKFPEIQDQVYDEEKNKVRIKVVCCCPEEVREKLCCKGRGCIKSIEILKPPKQASDQQAQKQPEKETQPDPPTVFLVPIRYCCTNCCKEGCKGPCYNPCYCYGLPVRHCGGYCGRSVCDGWCGGGGYGGYYGCRCGEYCYCQRNSQICMIM